MGSKMRGWSWMECDVLLGQLSPVSGSHVLFPLLPKGAIQNKDKKGPAQLFCAPLLGTWKGCSSEGEGSSALRWQITLNRSHASEQCPAMPITTASRRNYTVNSSPAVLCRSSCALLKPSCELWLVPARLVALAAQCLWLVCAPEPLPCSPAPTRCQEEAECGRGGRHSTRDEQHLLLPEPWLFSLSQLQNQPYSQSWPQP